MPAYIKIRLVCENCSKEGEDQIEVVFRDCKRPKLVSNPSLGCGFRTETIRGYGLADREIIVCHPKCEPKAQDR